jgi:hypothetical protein
VGPQHVEHDPESQHVEHDPESQHRVPSPLAAAGVRFK